MKRFAEIITNTGKFKNSEYLPLLAIALCYLIFPNNNPTTDAWEYAANVKLGEELIRPHHLCYNPLMYIVTRGVRLLGDIDILKIMQITNGIFVIFSLWVLRRLLLLCKINRKTTIIWILFTGSTFSLLRYGTENETYIIPIFFSLLSSLCFKYYLNRPGEKCLILASSILGALGCLFHQVHIFWWMGIALGLILHKDMKALIIYLTGGLLIPVCYIFVLTISSKIIPSPSDIIEFGLPYYFSGNNTVSIGFQNVILTSISFFRSFFQLHGNIVDFFLAKPIVSTLVLLLIIYQFIKSLRKGRRIRIIKNNIGVFERVHMYILLMQLAFAFISDGNAEFMVMVPVVMVLSVASIIKITPASLKYFSYAMLLWNISFAILPNHYYDFHNNKEIVELIDDNRYSIFALEENLKITAQHKYLKGYDASNRILGKYDQLDTISASSFYTDLLTKKMPFSRASLVSIPATNKFMFKSHFAKIDSFYGNYYIDEVETLKSR